jgi:hypothetical protein
MSNSLMTVQMIGDGLAGLADVGVRRGPGFFARLKFCWLGRKAVAGENLADGPYSLVDDFI